MVDKLQGCGKHIFSYRATYARAWWELSTTLVLWIALLALHERINKPLFYLALSLTQSRVFIVFHDAGHNSFFPSTRFNSWLWRILSIILMTPGEWKNDHRLHHSYFGDRENKANYQWNPTIYLTKQEVEKLRPECLRAVYVFLRHPIVYFPVSTFYEWFIRFRIPPLGNLTGYTAVGNYKNTAGVMVMLYLFYLWKGDYSLMIDYLFGSYLGGLFGITLFHAQHAFEDGYVRNHKDWDFTEAAFLGSSFIEFPWFLKWFTMGIEYHHIHHYDSKVPGYLLQQCHEEGDPAYWKSVPTLDMAGYWKALGTTLYDETTGKFI